MPLWPLPRSLPRLQHACCIHRHAHRHPQPWAPPHPLDPPPSPQYHTGKYPDLPPPTPKTPTPWLSISQTTKHPYCPRPPLCAVLQVLQVWAQVLLAVPNSRLVLKNKPFACEVGGGCSCVCVGLGEAGCWGGSGDIMWVLRTELKRKFCLRDGGMGEGEGMAVGEVGVVLWSGRHGACQRLMGCGVVWLDGWCVRHTHTLSLTCLLIECAIHSVTSPLLPRLTPQTGLPCPPPPPLTTLSSPLGGAQPVLEGV